MEEKDRKAHRRCFWLFWDDETMYRYKSSIKYVFIMFFYEVSFLCCVMLVEKCGAHGSRLFLGRSLWWQYQSVYKGCAVWSTRFFILLFGYMSKRASRQSLLDLVSRSSIMRCCFPSSSSSSSNKKLELPNRRDCTANGYTILIDGNLQPMDRFVWKIAPRGRGFGCQLASIATAGRAWKPTWPARSPTAR